MNVYLTKHAYQNTVTEDLWDALGEASGKPVRRVSAFMSNCLHLITVTINFPAFSVLK